MHNPDYLDPRWQRFRLKRLELAGWQCEMCGDATSKLNIHHRFYIAGRKPWEYIPETTIVLCDQCHEIQHEFSADFQNLGPDRWERFLAWHLENEGYPTRSISNEKIS